MDAMIVNVTTEASRFAGRAVVAVLLLVGFWLAGLMVQRLMAGSSAPSTRATTSSPCWARSPRGRWSCSAW